VNNINLDKTCAEYGMDLLALYNKVYKKLNYIIKNCSDLSEFKSKRYEDEETNPKTKEFGDYFLGIIKDIIKDNANEFKKLQKKEKPLTFDAKTFETEITKALGILVEDGPFAYMIWLKSQDKEPHRAMLIQTARVLKELNLIREIEPTENLKEKLENIFLGDISSGLTKTLFVKTILEKMLIYARYKAKAMQHE